MIFVYVNSGKGADVGATGGQSASLIWDGLTAAARKLLEDMEELICANSSFSKYAAAITNLFLYWNLHCLLRKAILI